MCDCFEMTARVIFALSSARAFRPTSTSRVAVSQTKRAACFCRFLFLQLRRGSANAAGELSSFGERKRDGEKTNANSETVGN